MNTIIKSNINRQVGEISNKVIELLSLNITARTPIFIGEANIKHIKQGHPNDFEKYGKNIKNIIQQPTYLARNEKKKSIEYIKEYKENKDYVLVAVRVSNNNVHFVRTMYVMDKIKVEKYHNHNYFITYDT